MEPSPALVGTVVGLLVAAVALLPAKWWAALKARVRWWLLPRVEEDTEAYNSSNHRHLLRLHEKLGDVFVARRRGEAVLFARSPTAVRSVSPMPAGRALPPHPLTQSNNTPEATHSWPSHSRGRPAPPRPAPSRPSHAATPAYVTPCRHTPPRPTVPRPRHPQPNPPHPPRHLTPRHLTHATSTPPQVLMGRDFAKVWKTDEGSTSQQV